MWPFENTSELRKEIEYLKQECNRLLEMDCRLKKNECNELKFLQEESKKYFTYRKCLSGWVGEAYTCYVRRSLEQDDTEFRRLRFYISVLECELGAEKVQLVKEKAEKLKELCKNNKEEAANATA